MNTRHILALLTLSASALSANADAPAGYYETARGKTGADLLTQLNVITKNPSVTTYDGLWTLFKQTDSADGAHYIDMYSTKQWSFSDTQCGNYSRIGDCMNREHSFPKSWFGGKVSPMYSDAYHLYPTDGYVNNQRSNYPFGECASGTYVSSSGGVKALGKLGNSTFAGYTGKVWEPDDQYKGDFARTYFYMVTAYNDKVASWSSDMLAKNRYPALSAWAVNMLLKWHHADPVSDKETARNDAVSRQQGNRNPFIDHPELADYIWGTKQGTPWVPGAAVGPTLIAPAASDVIDFGTIATGAAKTLSVAIKGSDFKDPLTASIVGGTSCFAIASATSFTAAAVNAGTTLAISFSNSATGSFQGTLRLKYGSETLDLALRATVVNGIPAQQPSAVSESSFVACWTNISADNATYTLHVEQGAQPVAGYPANVPAASGSKLVNGLRPLTTYTYYLTSGELISNKITVTTLAPQPSISFYTDDEIDFTTQPGVPSRPLEIMMDVDNIATPISIAADAPFQLSSDLEAWTQTITLQPSDEHFYMRLLSDIAGTFSTAITATAGSYVYDDIELEGVVSDPAPDFLEDFEANQKGNYDNGEYVGSACKWMMENIGVYDGDKANAYAGARAARFGKNSNSTLTMLQAFPAAVSTVSFYSAKWTASEADATIVVEYSADNGSSWTAVGSADIKDAQYQKYSFNTDIPANSRLRLRQNGGARIFVDDIALTKAASAEATIFNGWTAFCRDSKIIVATDRPSLSAEIYSVDGSTIAIAPLAPGLTPIAVPTPGLYIVVIGDNARKVLVH